MHEVEQAAAFHTHTCPGCDIQFDCRGSGCTELDEICEECSQYEEAPDIDDSVKCCPDCEGPNQFGELCVTCARERGEQPYA
jgi:hypothetical protein